MRFGPPPDGGPRLGRLTKRSEFQAAARGRRFNTDRVTVQALRRPDGEMLRVGFTLTRKVGHATERNRIRRRLREAARAAFAESGTVPLDLVLVGRREALAADYATLLSDLGRALEIVQRPRADGAGGRSGAGASRPKRRT